MEDDGWSDSEDVEISMSYRERRRESETSVNEEENLSKVSTLW